MGTESFARECHNKLQHKVDKYGRKETSAIVGRVAHARISYNENHFQESRRARPELSHELFKDSQRACIVLLDRYKKANGAPIQGLNTPECIQPILRY